jgi:DNA-binding response OmpR family regulator
MKKILLAEDEFRMRKLIKDYLQKYGYQLVEAEDGEQALELYIKEKPDLVVADWMMPNMDGIELCHEIKQMGITPVIMLTAKSEEKDELEGLKFGADDYIRKPFSPKILMARIEALLRYTDKFIDRIEEKGIYVDEDKHKVYLDSVEVEFTPKEYEMLIYMIKNQNLVLSREKILDSIWGYEYDGDLRTIDTNIKRIRKKLGGRFITTVRGYGYKFEVEK